MTDVKIDGRSQLECHHEAVIRRVFAEIVNRGRRELIDELYDPDVVDHDPFPGAPQGRAGVRYTLGRLRSLYPDVEVTINELTCQGNMVTLRNTWRGTFGGPRAGKEGRRVEYDGVVVFRFEDGLIAERWAALDIDRMLDQLGVEAAAVRAAGIPLDGADARSTSTLRALGQLIARSDATSASDLRPRP